jgi:hypothetical protein
VDWTLPVILHRLLWVAAAVGTAMVASIFFHRFDPARETWNWKRNSQLPAQAAVEELSKASAVSSVGVSAGHLTTTRLAAGQTQFAHLLRSELRLMLKGHRWWWYLTAAGLFIGCLAAPLDAARGGLLVAAWLWPVLIWSQMGAREARHATQALIFSSQRALYRQLPAVWVAGVLVALLTGSGIGVRLLVAGDGSGLAAWLAGALFIPSLALALGVWSGTSKPFEALYTAWWYIGPAHHVAGLDFMGTTAASGRTTFYVLAAVGLVAVSYFGRRVRLGYV